jgi:hypothetical protein
MIFTQIPPCQKISQRALPDGREWSILQILFQRNLQHRHQLGIIKLIVVLNIQYY